MSVPAGSSRNSGRVAPFPTRRTRVAEGARSQTTTPASRSARRLSGSRTVPPPHAITSGSGEAHTSATTARSISRKRGSPSRAKMPRTLSPARLVTRSSVSTKARPRRRAHSSPTVVLPAPINPIRTRCRVLIVSVVVASAWSGERRAVRVVVAHELAKRVAAELAQRLRGEHQGDHRFGDDTGGREERAQRSAAKRSSPSKR